MSGIIDLIENFCKDSDLTFCRTDENELQVSLSSNYDLSVFLKPEYEILHFSNDMGLVCPKSRLAVMEDSIIKANERIWTGHFDLISSDSRIVYSLTLPFVYSFFLDESSVESIFDLIRDESDRFYDYFKMILTNKQIKDFSISSLFQEAVGEA